VECDELWSFIGKKQKRVKPSDGEHGGLLRIRRNRAPFQAGAEHRGWQARPGHHGCFYRKPAPRHAGRVSNHN
jgi:hypothetical protein